MLVNKLSASNLPKMYKPRAANSAPHFHQIVSSIGTYNYNLVKFLSNRLQPHIPSGYVASDTFTFVLEINGFSVEGKFMVSFDVESLFTNIPLCVMYRPGGRLHYQRQSWHQTKHC